MKTIIKIFLLSILVSVSSHSIYAQSASSGTVVISAKNLYEGLKNNSLKFERNQAIIVTGILSDTGSSFIYNSAYLLISDKADGHIYVKAILADKKKRDDYKNGQNIRIRCRFYADRDTSIIVKDTRNE